MEEENRKLREVLEQAEELIAINEVENAYRISREQEKRQLQDQQEAQSQKFRHHNDTAVLRKQHNNLLQQIKALKQQNAILAEENKKLGSLVVEQPGDSADEQRKKWPRRADDVRTRTPTMAPTKSVSSKAATQAASVSATQPDVCFARQPNNQKQVTSLSQTLLHALQMQLSELHHLAQLSRSVFDSASPGKKFQHGTGVIDITNIAGTGPRASRLRGASSSRSGDKVLSSTSWSDGNNFSGGSKADQLVEDEYSNKDAALPRLMASYERALQAAAVGHSVNVPSLGQALIQHGRELLGLSKAANIAPSIIQCCWMLVEVMNLEPLDAADSKEIHDPSTLGRATKDLRGSFAAAAAGVSPSPLSSSDSKGEQQSIHINAGALGILHSGIKVPALANVDLPSTWKQLEGSKRCGKGTLQADATLFLRDICRSHLFTKYFTMQASNTSLPSTTSGGIAPYHDSTLTVISTLRSNDSGSGSTDGISNGHWSRDNIEDKREPALEAAVASLLVSCLASARHADADEDECSTTQFLPLLRAYEGHRATLLCVMIGPYAGPRTRTMLLQAFMQLLQSEVAFATFQEAEAIVALNERIVTSAARTAGDNVLNGIYDEPFFVAFIHRYIMPPAPYTPLTPVERHCNVVAVRFLQHLLRTHGAAFTRVIFQQDVIEKTAPIVSESMADDGRRKRGLSIAYASGLEDGDATAVTLLIDCWVYYVRLLDKAPPLLLVDSEEHHSAILASELTYLLNSIAVHTGFERWSVLMDSSLEYINSTVAKWEVGASLELHHSVLKDCSRNVDALDLDVDIAQL